MSKPRKKPGNTEPPAPAEGPHAEEDFTDRIAALLQPAAFGLVVVLVGVRPMLPHQYDLDAFFFGLTLLAGVMWFSSMLLIGEVRIRRTGLELPVLGLVLVTAASNFYAVHLISGLAYTLNFIGCVLIFLIATNLPPVKGRKVIHAAAATAVVLAAYGAYQKLFGLERMLDAINEHRQAALHAMHIGEQHINDAISRVKSGQVFATFHNPNLLAGFLVLAAPVLIGWCVSLLRRGERVTRRVFFAILVCLLALVCLWWTDSKGAALSVLVGCCVMAGTLAAGRLPWRGLRWLPFAGAFVVLAASTVFLPPSAWRKVAGESMQVRAEYACAGRRMIARHPVLGVGADNFSVHYTVEKPPFAREVRNAHNSWLQMTAELGAFGAALLVWLAFSAAGICMRGFKPVEAEEPPRNHGSGLSGLARRLLPGFGVIAMAVLLGSALGMDVSDDSLVSGVVQAIGYIAAVLLWTATFRLLDAVPTRVLRMGCVAGVTFFAFHNFVDFSWYEPGVSVVFWAMLGFVCGGARGVRSLVWRPVPVLQMAASGGVVLMILLYAFPVVGPMPRMMAAASHKNLAWNLLAPDHPEDLTSPDRAVDAYRKAIEANPLDDDTYYQLGKLFERLHEAKAYRGRGFALAIWCYERASELNPRQAAYYFRRSRLFLLTAEHEPERLKGYPFVAEGTFPPERKCDDNFIERAYRQWPVVFKGAATLLGEGPEPPGRRSSRARLLPALIAMTRTVAAYPSHAMYRVELGRIMRKLGWTRQARRQYRRAAEFDDAAPIERLHLKENIRREVDRWLDEQTD